MAKKEKKNKKEELMDLLNELSENENTSPEDKEKIKEIVEKLDEIHIYSRGTFILGYVIVNLLRLAITYVLSLALIGLFSSFLVLENKLYVFLIPAGISLLFLTLSVVADLFLKIKGNIIMYVLKGIAAILVFSVLNYMYPIFEFKTIWVFYIGLIILFEDYFIFKLVRRKL